MPANRSHGMKHDGYLDDVVVVVTGWSVGWR